MANMNGLENILEFAKQAFQSYNDEDEVSPESEMLLAIIKARRTVDNPVVPTNIIANEFNLERETNERWKTNAVGRLVKRLGFNAKRTSSGRGGFLLTQKHLDRLSKRYNIPETSVQVKIQ